MKSTMVLDPGTLGAALVVLGNEINQVSDWRPVEGHRRQQQLLNYFGADWELYEQLEEVLKTKTSTSHLELNAFLEENGFAPAFREIGRGGIGVATLLDLMMKWLVEAKASRLYANDYPYRAFELPAHGVMILNTDECDSPLVRIPTENGGLLWLAMTDRPADELAMIEKASRLLGNDGYSSTEYAGVVIPTLEIDTAVDLSWMLGLHQHGHYIDQAFQQVRLRLNEAGARMKAATGLASTRGGTFVEQLMFDKPFLGFFTLNENANVPVGVFYAEQDCWREPAGSLEAL